MKTIFITIVVLAAALFASQQSQGIGKNIEPQVTGKARKTQSAVFAGGCFWCTESDFEKVPGVIDVISGYSGGHVADPNYKQVSAGGTGHLEVVKVIYDPDVVNYTQLLDWFWRHIDPTDAGGQFVDRGAQYRSVIFYADEEQRRQAEQSKAELEVSGRFDKPVVTEILLLGPFYPAEDYHQDYYKKNPLRYKYYRWGSGRDQFLEKTWGKAGVDKLPDPAKQVRSTSAEEVKMNKSAERIVEENRYEIPDDEQLRNTLTPLQYRVTRKDATEPAFDNTYWDNHEQGIYVDIISGEPLFSSTDKYESGTGWPSFIRPLEPKNIVENEDRSWFWVRTEVRSKHADSHLGHVFDDGPPPTGLRYCLNSAALRFIPKSELTEQGYGIYLELFPDS